MLNHRLDRLNAIEVALDPLPSCDVRCHPDGQGRWLEDLTPGMT
jgi:hypothetical protein